MQQLHATTEPRTEQSLSYTPAQSALPAEHAATQTETSLQQQERSEAVEKLLAALEQDTRTRKKWNETTLQVFMVCMLAFWAAWGVTWLISKQAAGVLEKHFGFVQGVNAFGWIVGSLFLNRKAAAELTTLNDVRCIGALVDVWGQQGSINHSAKTRRKACLALTRLLPQLKASDAGLLREPQRAALRGVLANNGYIAFGKHQDAAFMVSILQAFEQIGDWKSLSCVQKLAREAKEPSVRAAAMECLPYLEALAEKQQPGENLRRASSASEAAHIAPDTLLRPAFGTEEAQPDTLLRSSGE